MIRAVVIMGPAACGKSTLAAALALKLGWRFVEGDALHPPNNVQKMSAGIPLTDADRVPFLQAVAQALRLPADGVVVSCSALKRAYRDQIRAIAGPVLFVLPELTPDALQTRMATRKGHFMPPSLLASQLAILQAPQDDELGMMVDGQLSTDQQVARVSERLQGFSDQGDCDMGLIGLAVMGENLALNLESHGFRLAVFNREQDRMNEFQRGRGSGKSIHGTSDLAELVRRVARPRKIMLMIRAGVPVDETLAKLIPLLAPGDIVIDGGNSLYTDTIRRCQLLGSQGLLFVGTGVSGGEEGALKGPALMPGGHIAAWPALRPIFEAIAARAPTGEPCCHWMGADGAGHFVKMVHNGIEYGDMQLIAESYDVMRRLMGLDNEQMATVFAEWNRGELESYLIEITGDILRKRDATGQHQVDLILDTAGQKGSGKWAVNAALELGVPLTLIAEAVFARFSSARREERVAAAAKWPTSTAALRGAADLSNATAMSDDAARVTDLRAALYVAKLVSYAQGFQLLRAAASAHGWQLNYGDIALTWRGGCIIRSRFLGEIKRAFDRNRELENLLFDEFFLQAVKAGTPALRRVIAAASDAEIALPCFNAALAYLDSFRAAHSPANMLQAQRDYFGAHQYERVDRPRGDFFHTNWTGRGGETTSETYSSGAHAGGPKSRPVMP